MQGGRINYAFQELSEELISKIADNYINKGQDKLYAAIHGFNLSYIDKSLANKLSVLWATVETLFGDQKAYLFSNEELEDLFGKIESLDFFKSDNNQWRLTRLKGILRNKMDFKNKTRNELIASSISKELNLDYNETYNKIRDITIVRGKNLHELRMDERQELQDAIEYLQRMIRTYIEKNLDIL